jgi:hypothetical protein
MYAYVLQGARSHASQHRYFENLSWVEDQHHYGSNNALLALLHSLDDQHPLIIIDNESFTSK